jgi:selenoprotein W-related protein
MIVEIEYCVPCGYLERALEAERAILEAYGQRIAGVTLKTGEKGVFTFSANGDTIYAKPEEFRLTEVVARIGARLNKAA